MQRRAGGEESKRAEAEEAEEAEGAEGAEGAEDAARATGGGAATEAGVESRESVGFWGVDAPSSRSGEMADAADSKSVASNGVWVQVPPPALENMEQTRVGASFMTPGVVTGRSWRRGWLGRFICRGFWCRLFLLSHAHVILHGAAVVETPWAAVEHHVRR